MLLILLACIYITIICFAWGVFVYRLLGGDSKNTEYIPHLSILCLLGFAAISAIAGILSLFMPLGGWQAQLIVLLPSVIFLLRTHRKIIIEKIRIELILLRPPALILFFVCLVMLLVMSSWKIVHPDTLGYQAQSIQWIEKYKVIPGIVHLHTRFGYQGLWFTSCALFSLKFLGSNATTFLNTTILLWYTLFIVFKINKSILQKENYLKEIFWILLLAISFWSYTQVRLTATSASPDFIANLFIWAIIYLLTDKKVSGKIKWLLISLLSLTAITIKLSALPVIIFFIIAAILFLKEKEIRLFMLLVVMAVITLLPFVARNVISSGYIVFPTTAVDIVNADWKYNTQLTNLENDYIKAYARTETDRSKEAIESSVNMKLSKWLPAWWANRSLADKTILIVFALTFFTSLLWFKKIISTDLNIKIALMIMLVGIIFWFINAPDPRFGFGFLIGFIAIVSNFLIPATRLKKLVLLFSLAAAVIAISVYSAYRFNHFFKGDQWLQPLGIEKINYKTIKCGEIKINQPPANFPFGNIPVPCTDDSCEHFILRGLKITDGFRAK